MNMTFVPGDYIIWRHKVGAKPRLVVATDEDPAYVIAFDAEDRHFKRCLCRIFDLVQPATDASREEAVSLTLSEAYERVAPKFNW
jgi:hypothetical protein